MSEKAPEQKSDAAEIAKRVSSRHEAMLRRASQETGYIFTGPIEVAEGDRLHGVGGIIEKKLLEAGIIYASTSAKKKNHMVHFLVTELEALDPDELRKLGFENGTARIIRTGEILDLSVLDTRGWVQAIR